jgi:hypothetical protein
MVPLQKSKISEHLIAEGIVTEAILDIEKTFDQLNSFQKQNDKLKMQVYEQIHLSQYLTKNYGVSTARLHKCD